MSSKSLARPIAAGCIGVALLAMATGANAAVYAFTGVQANVDAASGPAAARCGARVTVTIGNGPSSSSIGASNFGAFSTEQSHCLTPPPTTYDLGEFEYDFASGDTLFGTYDGVLTPSSPGIFDNDQSFIVTGGSGLFAGATGSFHGTGYVNFLGDTPAAALTFAGEIQTPAGAPEPAAWALLILGFGGIGSMLRGRRVALLR